MNKLRNVDLSLVLSNLYHESFFYGSTSAPCTLNFFGQGHTPEQTDRRTDRQNEALRGQRRGASYNRQLSRVTVVCPRRLSTGRLGHLALSSSSIQTPSRRCLRKTLSPFNWLIKFHSWQRSSVLATPSLRASCVVNRTSSRGASSTMNAGADGMMLGPVRCWGNAGL